MAKYNITQSNFTAGELTPLLYGRFDATQLYNSGCSTIKNMFIYPYGGANKRLGTKYIATAATPTKAVRLIPFEYSATEAYILEFGDKYIRFYTDGGIITSGGVPYEITTTYSAEDLVDIKYVQSADTYYLTHKDYPVKKLIRNDYNDWTIEDVTFVGGPFLDDNDTTTTINPSDVTGDITLTASTSIFTSDHVGSIYRIGGTTKVSRTVTAESQWTDSIKINKGETVNLTVNGIGWSASISVQRSLDSGSTWKDYYVVTSNIAVQLTESESNDAYYRVGVDTGNFIKLEEVDAADDDSYDGRLEIGLENISAWGYVKVTGYTSTKVVSATVKRILPASDATTDWSEGAWGEVNGYPRAVTFFEQRLVFAGTTKEPQDIWASKIDDYEDFTTGDEDDDSYNYSLVSNQLNNILWMVENRVLHCGSLGGEWKFGLTDEATTPTSVDAKNQTSDGATGIQGIIVNNNIIFIQRGGKALRSKIYDYNIDGYKSINISTKAAHLFDSGIIDMSLQSGQTPIIWMVTADGDMIGCTYMPDQGIIAYHQHTTEGTFESITTIPNADGGDDEIWVVVKRTIDGTSTRYIEQLQNYEWTDVKTAYYSDCAIGYSGTAKTSFDGADHLEGKECTVLADGAVLPNVTISDGAFTIDFAAENVIVGLPYTAELTSLPITPVIEAGSSFGKQKALWKIYLQLYKTIGIKIGSSSTNVDIVPFRSSADNMDEGVPLFSGVKEIEYLEGFDQTKQITIISDQPLPLTILSNTTSFYSSPA